MDSSQLSLHWNGRSLIAERKTALEAWRDQSRPRLHASIAPWALYFVDSADKPSSIALLIKAVTELAMCGPSKHRLSALDALRQLLHAKSGHQMGPQSYWGEVRRLGDFAEQELTVDCFHFHVIDFGDPIPLQEALMRSTGNAENVERGHRAPLHLSAGMLWKEYGRSSRAPYRKRVCSLSDGGVTR